MRTAPLLGTVRDMALILTILIAFPLGYFVRNRAVAYVTYIAADGFVFTYQTLYLLLLWVGGATDAFGGPFPEANFGQVWSYGPVNLTIIAVGIGLVTLGARVARRRRDTSVDLTSPTL